MRLTQNRQSIGTLTSQRIAKILIGGGKLRTVQCVGIFVDLLRRLKVLLVAPVVIELTLVGRVVATNLRPGFVNPTSMIVLKMFAGGVYEQIPAVFLHENCRAIVQQVPADVVKILAIGRFVDRQCKVVTTLCRAVIAQILAFWHLIAFHAIR